MFFQESQNRGNMPSNLKKIKNKVKLLLRIIKWRLVDWPLYLKYSALKQPDNSDCNKKDLEMLREYYENGITLLDKIDLETQNYNFLNTVRELFEPMIEKYNTAPIKDKDLNYFDEKGRFWKFNNAKGGLSVSFTNENHPFSQEKFYPRDNDVKSYCFQDACDDFPFLKQLTHNTKVLRLFNYANFGEEKWTQPYSIKLERRTNAFFDKATGPVDRWPHIPHLDHHKTASKCFLYLNDVNEENGPIALSPSSHHWKLYPMLTELFLARKKTVFSNQIIKKMGVNPLKPYCAQAGTLLCFSTNAIHGATNIAEGKERWSVHLLYYTEKDWATDKLHRNNQLLQKGWERFKAIFAFPVRENKGDLESILN